MSPSVILMLFYIWEDASIWTFFWKYLPIWRPVLFIISPLSTEYLTPDLHQELLSGDAKGPQLQWRGRLCCSVTQLWLTLQLHGLQHNRLPCSSPSPGACSDSCPLSLWCHPTILFSVVPFSSCLLSQCQGLFQWVSSSHPCGQSIGASASVLPMNIQGWFPLGWTGWISLQSKGLSRVFSNTIVQKHPFLMLSFLYHPTLTSMHDYWKNHSLDYMDTCQQTNVSAF